MSCNAATVHSPSIMVHHKVTSSTLFTLAHSTTGCPYYITVIPHIHTELQHIDTIWSQSILLERRGAMKSEHKIQVRREENEIRLSSS